MHRIATGVHFSGDHHYDSNLERANLLFGNRRDQRLLVVGEAKAFTVLYALRRLVLVAIEPALDRAGLGVEHDAQPSECPTIVSHRHKEARRKAIERSDLATDQGDSSAKAHRSDVQSVRSFHYIIFKCRQLRIGIRIVERSEELLLRVLITGCSIAANARADGACAAALTLSLPDRMQNAFAHSVQVATRAPQVWELNRN